MDRKVAESLKEKDLFVHIGDAELRAAFPAENPTITALYDEITKKQRHLAKLKILSEKIAEREQQADVHALIADRERLKTHLQTLQSDNEEMKSLLKRKELDLEKAKKEVELKRKRNEEHLDMLKALEGVVEKREKERNEIKEKKMTFEATRAALEDVLAEKEAVAEDVQNCLVRDGKTIQELETYFKKLTKRVFDKQTEFDKMRVGRLPPNNNSVNKTSLVDRAKSDNATHVVSYSRNARMSKNSSA
uniref:Coiled-coil domain-containing protein 176 n=1 Tax=Steinernema glaseri TaxID=37863 RepID=A0A1I7Z5S4_9BILA